MLRLVQLQDRVANATIEFECESIFHNIHIIEYDVFTFTQHIQL